MILNELVILDSMLWYIVSSYCVNTKQYHETTLTTHDNRHSVVPKVINCYVRADPVIYVVITCSNAYDVYCD